MDKPQRARLMKEDEREERELRGYVAQSLTAEMISSIPDAANAHGAEVKTPAQLEQEQAAWASQQDSR